MFEDENIEPKDENKENEETSNLQQDKYCLQVKMLIIS